MAQKPVTIQNSDPLIYFHGRWDASPGTWWAGSGFKLNVKNLESLTLNLGPHTTAPFASIGVSLDYGEFITANISQGSNPIPILVSSNERPDTHTTVVRVNVEGWQNNRINLESVTLNPGASLVPYIPSKLAFQFVGDSLSAGQFLPKGVDQAWPFLVGEAFKAEHVVVAQPGAALSDIVSFGNEHGVSFQFFRTEDTGYFYTTDHNFTTPWNFARDEPAATHVVIHIGANDSAQNVTDVQFVQVYTEFIARLRTIYRHQPIFVFTPWGWPNPDGTVSQYFEGQYQKIVDLRHASGDKSVFLVDTTGWVSYADVFPENVHPNIPGHQHIADKFQAWLENWGLKPESRWATPV
ncbi:SGNH hydrolase-type esterase domain-containing protein [Mycena albidolilacea]|uniref:SGNH hydrolase-type esterase domain-containing protein n=1 Tax=Mycena albidolilacea TaxID=1033008 RepID=A0AAD7F576_9AGAR|nr:SGNH hydrolase-type esterase domain-containing protein [Mycena albidolilacea]